MARSRFSVIAVATTAVFLATSGCSSPPTQREVGSAVLGAAGAVGGGLLGSTIGGGLGRTAAIIGGSALGSAAGAGVGRRLPNEPLN